MKKVVLVLLALMMVLVTALAEVEAAGWFAQRRAAVLQNRANRLQARAAYRANHGFVGWRYNAVRSPAAYGSAGSTTYYETVPTYGSAGSTSYQSAGSTSYQSAGSVSYYQSTNCPNCARQIMESPVQQMPQLDESARNRKVNEVQTFDLASYRVPKDLSPHETEVVIAKLANTVDKYKEFAASMEELKVVLEQQYADRQLASMVTK